MCIFPTFQETVESYPRSSIQVVGMATKIKLNYNIFYIIIVQYQNTSSYPHSGASTPFFLINYIQNSPINVCMRSIGKLSNDISKFGEL